MFDTGGILLGNELMDYAEEPGDLDPIGPNLARDYADANQWDKAIHFFEIWLKEYDNEKYRGSDALRSTLSGAYCDLATALMVVNQWGNTDKSLHNYLEAISLHDSTKAVATHNLYILISMITKKKVSTGWFFRAEELKSGWRLLAREARDRFKRGNFSEALGLYLSATEENPDCVQLMHGLTLSIIADKCASEDDPSFLTALNLLTRIHEKDSGYKFHIMQVPTPQMETTKKKSGRCFIATAACGSACAHEVLSLQLFRDSILRQSVAGRLFIQVYQIMSPPLARIIDRNNELRRFTLRNIVRPMVKVANEILRSRVKEV